MIHLPEADQITTDRSVNNFSPSTGRSASFTVQLASATHGQPRLTEDIDLVIELRAEQVDALKRELGAEFEVDELALAEAAKTLTADNVFYLPDFTRFDLHIAKQTEFV